MEFWRLSQALKKSTLRVNFTAEIPLKFRRRSEKRESPEVGTSDIEVFTFSLDHFVTNLLSLF